jgi:hypothetical protein
MSNQVRKRSTHTCAVAVCPSYAGKNVKIQIVTDILNNFYY